MKHFLFIGPDRHQNNGPSVFSRKLTTEIENQQTHITYISKENSRNHIFRSFNQYDSILINSTSLLPLIFIFQIMLYKKSKRKILFVLHGEMGKEVTGILKKTLLQRLQSFLLHQSTSIVFVSSMFMHDFFNANKHHKSIKEKAIVIPNGVDDAVKSTAIEDRPLKSTIDIVYVGGKRLEKGYALLREFLQHPIEFKGKHVNFHLIGFKETDHLAIQKNINAYFYPTLSHADVITKYNTCDIFLSTSLYETFGIAILEAYSRGCKVVTYKKVGALDLIEHDRSVFAYDALTIESLHLALQKAIDFSDKPEVYARSSIPSWHEVSTTYLHTLQPQK